MRNALLSRFSNVALVAPEMQQNFEACLAAAAGVEHLPEMLAMQTNADEGYWPSADSWMFRYRPYIVNDGILQIPVKGVLLSDFGFQIGSWATGYTYILRAFQRGMEDENVRAIAFIINSPGGDAAECFDVVDKMFAMRDTKPVRAFAAEHAYSGAYAIASVAKVINVSRTGGVGSIGVVSTHFDVSGSMEKNGYKVTFIFSGKHKVDGNSYEPLPADVKARIQARVDDLREVFVSTIARNRGMDPKIIRDTEALTYGATEAVSNGLADSIGTLDDALAAYAVDLSQPDDGEEDMSTKDESAANQAAVDQARADGVASGKKEGVTEGTKAGVAAERTRITSILGSEEGKKRPKAALSAALRTDMTVEQASAFLADLGEEKAESVEVPGKTPFEKVMDEGEQPNVGAVGVDTNGTKLSVADTILQNAGYGAAKK